MSKEQREAVQEIMRELDLQQREVHEVQNLYTSTEEPEELEEAYQSIGEAIGALDALLNEHKE